MQDQLKCTAYTWFTGSDLSNIILTSSNYPVGTSELLISFTDTMEIRNTFKINIKLSKLILLKTISKVKFHRRGGKRLADEIKA